MASYDWFAPTQQDIDKKVQHAEVLKAKSFTEEGYPTKSLVCALCGCIVYGTVYQKFADLHRMVCRVPTTEGKHRA